ncbi:MAG: hypothetical protein NTX15_07970 [Candidatus Kapabacteria bacterium]|nr:hypothetical protein [Candidatus Kapabacteria bacterium]
MSTTMLGVAEDKALGRKAIEFILEDQFKQEWSWAKHWKGKPTVIVMSDRSGSDYTDKWAKPLANRFKDRVQYVAIADVSAVPGFIKGLVRGKFKDAFTNSILLDWDGHVCEYYLMQSGLPNVLFIDSEGTVRLHTWGKGAQEHVDAFAENVERILSRQ